MKLKLYKKQHIGESSPMFHIAKDGICIFSTQDYGIAKTAFNELRVNPQRGEEEIIEEWESEQEPFTRKRMD